jgi:hypothetical protein
MIARNDSQRNVFVYDFVGLRKVVAIAYLGEVPNQLRCLVRNVKFSWLDVISKPPWV